MRRWQRQTAAALVLAMALAACGEAGGDSGAGGGDNGSAGEQAGELNALVWCDHTDPELLQPFEEEHGVTVNVRDYEGTGVALNILEQSQPGDWDVLVVDSVDVPRVAEAGWLAELSPDDFPWDDFFPDVRLPEVHEVDGSLYAVPEKFGYNTIAFNNDEVEADTLRDLSSLWDPQLNGRIAVYDYYIPVMELIAIELGIEPDEITMEDLPAIEERLLELKEQSALTGDVVSVQTALATGEVDVVVGGGEYVTGVLHEENPAMDWILPDQGGIRWQQAIGVVESSQNKELATEFVKYIVSPEGQARLATSSCYWAMPANSQAELSDDEKAVLRWEELPSLLHPRQRTRRGHARRVDAIPAGLTCATARRAAGCCPARPLPSPPSSSLRRWAWSWPRACGSAQARPWTARPRWRTTRTSSATRPFVQRC
jgi:spermidine/putrescine transport system substrate-binding protein